jgi:hypothetical protein
MTKDEWINTAKQCIARMRPLVAPEDRRSELDVLGDELNNLCHKMPPSCCNTGACPVAYDGRCMKHRFLNEITKLKG